ncbi:hypothetical protein [Cohnella mopanensis]|nr:hypothetical protein [Cohnella mopanensis]
MRLDVPAKCKRLPNRPEENNVNNRQASVWIPLNGGNETTSRW